MGKTIYTGAQSVVARCLIEARWEAGLTQVQVAALIDRPQSVISMIETGQRQVTVLEFVALMRAMGRDAAEVFAKVAENIPEAKKL